MASVRTFACFGTACTVRLDGDVEPARAAARLEDAERTLLDWHARFSRFEPGSELSRLNADPRATVPASPTMVHFVLAARAAAELTGGLVDPTLVAEIERAGYVGELGERPPLREALALAAARTPGTPRPERRWNALAADPRAGTVTRPPSVRLDSGGIAKGLFADLLGARLRDEEAWVVDCGGDLRLGGTAALGRPVDVRSPFDPEQVLHRFVLVDGGVATSSIGHRSWLGADGRPAHHLLDPGSGRPAYTGVVQVTALAPTGAEAEARAKAALLAGPEEAERWLAHGGVVVLDDGSHRVRGGALAGRHP